MKVIVTGATGPTGAEVVKQCIADPRVTNIIIITRRNVQGGIESHPKVEVMLHSDFSHYTENLVKRLDGADACLWAIGSHSEPRADSKAAGTKESVYHVSVELPLIAAKMLSRRIARSASSGGPFRFIFVSDKTQEGDPKKTFPFLGGEKKKSKGEVEKGLAELTSSNKPTFQAFVLRPQALLLVPPGTDGAKKGSGIEPPQLARAMIRVAVEGYKTRWIDNETLLKLQ